MVKIGLRGAKIMKSQKIKNIWGWAFALLCGAFFSCNHIGLGPEVDLIPPAISVLSHSDNDIVPSEFTLLGTAYDNEEVTSIEVNFDYQDLHYRVEPGKEWYKKTRESGDWVAVAGNEGTCVKKGSMWEWSLYIDSAEGNADGTTYELSATVTDAIGNSSSKSKVDISLIMDEYNPDVSIYKPELLNGSAEAIALEASGYSLCDGNVLSKLLNGDLTFTGRQKGSVSFKELRIDFDDGSLSSGVRKVTGDAPAQTGADAIAESVSLGDEESPTVYYSKTLVRGQDGITDLRNWELYLPQSEWVSSEKNPELLSLGEKTGSAKLIRIVTTSLSDSNAWEKKVIGWFLWWPEADFPWVEAYMGDDEDRGEETAAVYPSSNFSGTVHDDDGISSFSYSVEKQDSSGKWSVTSAESEIALSDEGSTYSAFTLKTPSMNGLYRIIFNVSDIYGKSVTKTKYIRVLDVNAPKVNITSPANGSSVLADKNGNITFSGSVGDDGSISALSLIYLNPLANDDPANIIRYMSGSEPDWDKALSQGALSEDYVYTDSDENEHTYQNKIYKIDLGSLHYDEGMNLNVHDFSKTLNIFTDLKIGWDNPNLVSQYFVLRAIDDSGATTIQQISLTGDSESPLLEIKSIQQFDENSVAKISEFFFEENSVPTLAPVNNGDYVILKGIWSDNSVISWGNDTSRINSGKITLSWKNADFTISQGSMNEDGSWNWTAKVTSIPKKSAAISASLQDLAGNCKSVSKSVFIETAELGLESIGCLNNDGSYRSGTLQLTLNFTKNTLVRFEENNPPQLKLNNGGLARYVSGGGESDSSGQHVFEYTISSSDSDTKDLNENGTLDVVEFISNGAKYYDASVSDGKQFEIELPYDSESVLGYSRSIKIDKTAPSISTVKAISSDGYYKAGKTLLFMLYFDEPVTVSGIENLKLVFNSFEPEKISAQTSGSTILLSYEVSEGESSAIPLAISSFKGLSLDSVKDEAGNSLQSWSWNVALDKDIYIDTSTPAAPQITKFWDDAKLVTEATQFTISGTESGASVEYSLDGGSSWLLYKNAAVSLSNNGTYRVKARQTDVAGNVSASSDGGSVTVEKGDILTRITADTPNGSYSVNKGGEVLGRIVFRKDISLPSNATVTLNVKSSAGSFKSCGLTKDASATVSGGSDYTFTYSIAEGDYIEGNAPLNVTGWSFSSVSYDTGIEDIGSLTFDLAFANTVVDSKSLKSNKSIYILTGKPEVEKAKLSGTVNSDGTVSEPKLSLTFDRNVSKVSGSISLELAGDSDSDSFIAPAVIESGKYSSAFDDWYEAGLNGAVKESNGKKLTNDTTTKYVLKYDKEPNDGNLINLFKNAGWNKVEIPIVASAVSISGKTVTVDLSSTYKLPVMGAKYKLTIPASSFSDDVQNKNALYTASVPANGVEPPVIRINKGKQTITPGTYTTEASVTMPSTASLRIDCQTPGASIYYGKAENSTSVFSVVDSNTKYDTKTKADSTIPDAPEADKPYSTALTLGDPVSDYSGAVGLKAAISAYAKKSGVSSATSYEYATRTVLKLRIDGGYLGNNRGYSDNDDGKYDTQTGITEGTTTLKFGNLRVWVTGGDSSYGGNSISPFPLAWHDSSSFKLMEGKFNDSSSMNGSWYWISWDISTATYHGFVIGDVPSDAGENGPSQWYSGEGAWDAQKANYILYPGETLEMCVLASSSFPNGSFRWCTKNHGQR